MQELLDLKQAIIADCQTIGPEAASQVYGTSKAVISNWVSGRNPPTLAAGQIVLGRMDFAAKFSAALPADEMTDLGGKGLMVLLPVYRSFCWGTHLSLFLNYSKFGPEKIGIILQHRTLIYEARNILVDKFLKTDAQWALFIDDDMILPCGNSYVMNMMFGARLPEPFASALTFQRLMKKECEDKLILGALYFGRGRGGKGQFAEAFENETVNKDSHVIKSGGSIRPVGWVGTGCMRIHRSVFEKMKVEAKRWPEIIPKNPTKPWGYFTPSAVGIGEDVSFCRRAAEIGIQSFLDTGTVCSHVGDEYFTHHNTAP